MRLQHSLVIVDGKSAGRYSGGEYKYILFDFHNSGDGFEDGLQVELNRISAWLEETIHGHLDGQDVVIYSHEGHLHDIIGVVHAGDGRDIRL